MSLHINLNHVKTKTPPLKLFCKKYCPVNHIKIFKRLSLSQSKQLMLVMYIHISRMQRQQTRQFDAQYRMYLHRLELSILKKNTKKIKKHQSYKNTTVSAKGTTRDEIRVTMKRL